MLQVVSNAEASRTLAGLRDSAMIRLMSDCLLRISEVVAVNVEDIGKVLTVRSSKTDQEGEGRRRRCIIGANPLTGSNSKSICKAAGIESGALCSGECAGSQHITPDRLSVNVSAGTRLSRSWAAEAGVEGFISGHSLRVSGLPSPWHNPERRS